MEPLIPFALAFVVILLLQVIILLRLSRTTPSHELQKEIAILRDGLARIERQFHDALTGLRSEMGSGAQQGRQELQSSLSSFSDNVRGQMKDIAVLQKNQLDAFSQQLAMLSQATEQQLGRMRDTIENRLHLMQDENNRKLDQMRSVVDEKLHATLEKRLGESFKLVSQRLEQVHQGLGEMQTLASGVGDLKKVLTNVKTRGTWGEVQLGTLLDQLLTPAQFSRNVATRRGSTDRVEFAIKLPGSGDDGEKVWLPIDAKFPMEDYQRLVEAAESANAPLVEQAGKMLENRIKGEAKSIKEKYLDPPHTTDFAIMFLATEGLYAEITRRTGLMELLQREYRVTVAGPNTIAAFLNSLQMGFRTLAVEKRTSEVWSLLGTVKSEFGRFGEILQKTQKKLQEASNTIEDATRRTRMIEHKLRDVQESPRSGETLRLFSADDESNDTD